MLRHCEEAIRPTKQSLVCCKLKTKPEIASLLSVTRNDGIFLNAAWGTDASAAVLAMTAFSLTPLGVLMHRQQCSQ